MPARGAIVSASLLVLGLISVAFHGQQSSFTSWSLLNSEDSGDAANLLVRTRQRAEVKWQQRHVAEAAAAAETAAASAATTATAASTPPSVTAAAATPNDNNNKGAASTKLTESERVAAGCGAGPPRPFHTVLTSSSGGYQAWQCRIMYYHFQLQRSRDPCGEMGGFTRLLTTRSGKDEGNSHADEIPTVVVKELTGMEARGYVVANRPFSMKQFVKHPAFKERIVEDYIYIAETDHVLLRPIPNLATRDTPAAFNFGYMVAWGQANIVNKFVPGLGGKTDPVGPSPVIIHREQLVQIADLWYDFTVKICSDGEAVQALGWVREMWGWCIAAGKLGIKHRVLEAFQYEGGSIGNRERRLAWPVAASPVGPERADMPYYIFHYTYGVEYSLEGLPMELQVGEWSMDKRHYMGGGPPRALHAPPTCAHDRAHVLRALWNNATANLPWGGTPQNTDKFNHLEFRNHPLRTHKVAAKLLGTGPWLLSGRDTNRNSAYRLEQLWILTNGWLGSSKGHGRWGLAGKEGGPYEEGVVVIKVCNQRLTVKLNIDAEEGVWTLEAGGSVVATLEQKAEVKALWAAEPSIPADALTARIEGSGPYRGAKFGSMYVLRSGVLVANGGEYKSYTRWHAPTGPNDAQKILLTKSEADTGGVPAHFVDCWIMRFPEAPSALSLLTGGSSDDGKAPPRYGAGIAERQAEWITQPPATLCEDVCAGLTLRRLTASDRAASPLARAVEDCCGWSWAGFGGLKFQPNGELVTPWGKGVWGAPPEGQSASRGKLLAEFAGFKHLLSVGVRSSGEMVGTSMSSVRCSDNDRSTVTLNTGKPVAKP